MIKVLNAYGHFVAHSILITAIILYFNCSTCCNAAVLVGAFSESSSEISPQNYDLTTLNGKTSTTVLDWGIWGEANSSSLSPTDSKNGGSGISDLSKIGVNGTLRGMSGDGTLTDRPTFQWSDGTPSSSANNVGAGIQNYNTSVGGVGLGFGLTLTGEAGVSRQVDVWFGSHRGTTRIEASLNGASSVFYDLEANESTNNKYGWATFTFTPDASDDLLTITTILTEETSTVKTGNSYFFATALSEGATAVPEPASAVIMLIGLGLLFLCRSKITARKGNA